MSIIDVYYLCNGMDTITFNAKINENKYRLKIRFLIMFYDIISRSWGHYTYRFVSS